MDETTKRCFKCQEVLPLSAFYVHKEMRDGHLNKCKECAQLDARQNRRNNVEYYRKKDCERSRLPHRKQARKKRVMEESELKRKARAKTNNALRDGRLHKEPCYFCDSDDRIEMHHPDYAKPLRIYWLCKVCHRKLDSMTKIGIV